MSKRVSERLMDISRLEDGWYYGEGTKYSADKLLELAKMFESEFNGPSPCTYPTIEGEISFEWFFDKCEFSVTVDLDTFNAECCTQYIAGSDVTRVVFVSLLDKDGWGEIKKEIARITAEEYFYNED